jgi:hypothetical protein
VRDLHGTYLRAAEGRYGGKPLGRGISFGRGRFRLRWIGGTGWRRNDRSGDSPERVTPAQWGRGLPAQRGWGEPARATTEHDARTIPTWIDEPTWDGRDDAPHPLAGWRQPPRYGRWWHRSPGRW